MDNDIHNELAGNGNDGWRNGLFFVAYLIYAAATLYFDIIFITMVGHIFGEGIMKYAGYGGAAAVGLSAVLLPLAAYKWFTPGLQMLWGVAFWVVEMLTMALNSMLAFQQAEALATGGEVDPLLAGWRYFSAATPLIAILGWGIVFKLDIGNKMRHTKSKIREQLINFTAASMLDAAKHPNVQRAIQEGTLRAVSEYTWALTGSRPGIPQLPPANGYNKSGRDVRGDNGGHTLQIEGLTDEDITEVKRILTENRGRGRKSAQVKWAEEVRAQYPELFQE